MRLKIDMEMDNDAFFLYTGELAAILVKIADEAEDTEGACAPRPIIDNNGNRVGSWQITEEK